MKTKNETRSPKLLVSVRNLNEAIEAIDGGCDWLDIKEPAHGPLGKPDNSTLAEISQHFLNEQIEIPLSTALGEYSEFDTQLKPSTPTAIQFTKFGLSGLASSTNWQDSLCEFYKNQTSNRPVAVHYADYERAESPRLEDVMEFAVHSKAPYFLIDTYIKDSKSLLDWMGESEIQQVTEFCIQNKIELALAGRIQDKDLVQLKSIRFDILAVRSAVCENGDRNKAVSRNAVAEFRATMASELSLNFGRDVAVTPAR